MRANKLETAVSNQLSWDCHFTLKVWKFPYIDLLYRSILYRISIFPFPIVIVITIIRSVQMST